MTHQDETQSTILGSTLSVWHDFSKAPMYEVLNYPSFCTGGSWFSNQLSKTSKWHSSGRFLRETSQGEKLEETGKFGLRGAYINLLLMYKIY